MAKDERIEFQTEPRVRKSYDEQELEDAIETIRRSLQVSEGRAQFWLQQCAAVQGEAKRYRDALAELLYLKDEIHDTPEYEHRKEPAWAIARNVLAGEPVGILEQIGMLRAKLQTARYVGDNHHNAAECPHCGDYLFLARLALDAPEWDNVWTTLNEFASGKTQESWSRVEPLGVLGHIYQALAIIYNRQREVVKQLKSGSGAAG